MGTTECTYLIHHALYTKIIFVITASNQQFLLIVHAEMSSTIYMASLILCSLFLMCANVVVTKIVLGL